MCKLGPRESPPGERPFRKIPGGSTSMDTPEVIVVFRRPILLRGTDPRSNTRLVRFKNGASPPPTLRLVFLTCRNRSGRRSERRRTVEKPVTRSTRSKMYVSDSQSLQSPERFRCLENSHPDPRPRKDVWDRWKTQTENHTRDLSLRKRNFEMTKTTGVIIPCGTTSRNSHSSDNSSLPVGGAGVTRIRRRLTGGRNQRTPKHVSKILTRKTKDVSSERGSRTVVLGDYTFPILP